MWSTLGERNGSCMGGGVWVFGPHTPRTRGTVTCDQKLFLCGFLCCTIHNGSGPNHG